MVKIGSKRTKKTDAELIRLALEKNEGAYLMLYKRYEGIVKICVSKLLTLEEDIEDICIESFEKAFRKLDTYDPQYQFSTWICTIATNTSLDHLNKHKRIRNNMPTRPIEIIKKNEKDDDFIRISKLEADIKNPEDDIIDQQEYDKLMDNIEKLKEEYREVARMRIIDNMAYQEIAEQLDMPLNTVKTRIRRAKDQLKKMNDISDELL